MAQGNRTFDEASIRRIVAEFEPGEPSLLPALQEIQRRLAYVPRESLPVVAEGLGVPLARVYSVATFYRAFSLEPVGEVLVRVCTGTTCHVCGSSRLLRALEEEFGTDGDVTIRTVNCLGACAKAPAVMIDERCHVGVDETSAIRLVADLAAVKGGCGDAS